MKHSRKNLAKKLIFITGFTLIIFFLITLSLQGVIEEIPFANTITFALITILTIAFLFERALKIKRGTIYEKFYSAYIGTMLISLTIIYWISFFNKIQLGVFNTFIVLTYILVFIYTLTTIKSAQKYWFIVLSYAFAVVISIIVFGFLYWTLSIFGVGQLQFSDCSSIQPELSSQNWFYFSSVTFYALGYGDICPILSPARFVSQIEVSFGALINTILIGFIFWKIREANIEHEVERKVERKKR